MRVFTSRTQKIGKLGEDLADKYLKNKGFSVIERNFTAKGGEIDIIAVKNNEIYFVEVKSRKCINFDTESNFTSIQPEQNVTLRKRKKFENTVQLYESQNSLENYKSVHLICICVYISSDKKVKVDIIDF